MAYARKALSAATRRAYASHLRASSHLRAWERWYQERGALPLPWSPTISQSLLNAAPTRRSPAELSAIVQAHALLGLPFDATDPGLRKTLQGIARSHGRSPQRRAAPLLTQDVIR